jgi:4-amino-4-deoxy-L-arabinose transferase-like glycosyltransferase
LCADRLSLNPDEGIYLDGALRVMHGQAPYRDFFVHTGPGTYWLYAGVFRLLGATLTHARLPVICEIAAIAAAVFFLTANLTSYAFGLVVTFVVFAFLTRDLGMIALNHRWDSSSLAFLAVAPAYAAIRRASSYLSFAAGVLAAAAAWCTPTLGIVALAIALWMAADREIRKLLPAFLLGMAAVSIPCVGILLVEQALVPLIHHFLWTGANYSGANHVPYGWAGTGYLEIGSGLGPVGWIFYALLLAVVAAPAVLPILMWLGWTLYFAVRRRPPLRLEKPVLFLIVCSVALVSVNSHCCKRAARP